MKTHSGNTKPQIDDFIVALVILTCVIFCDILLVIIVLNSIGVIQKTAYTYYLDLLLALGILLFNFFFFFHNKKYLDLFEYFQQTEDDKTFKKKTAYCLAFIIVSVAILVIIPVLFV